MNHFLTIAAVSGQTGIGKEVLRQWEARYGFPVPDRGHAGARLYSPTQVRRLQLIKRLLDDGMRPGKVVLLDEAQLTALLAARGLAADLLPKAATAQGIVQWLQAHDPELLRTQLHGEIARRGLGDFILNAMPALNEAVGHAWASGDISISDEHLYTETVKMLIRQSLVAHAGAPGRPRILLTTPASELHGLGLLMLQALMTLEGASCIALGANLPLAQIAQASQAYRADIVALSFSAAFARKKIGPILQALRSLCPETIDIWAGDAGVARMDTAPKGVSVMPLLEDALKALKNHRLRQL